MADVYVCKESGAFEYGGDMIVVNKGVTRVRAGHPILDLYPELFEPITVHYDIEQMTAAPGEKRHLSVRQKTTEETPSDEGGSSGDDELAELQEQAKTAGVKVDKRWGPDRLRQEIADASTPKGKA